MVGKFHYAELFGRMEVEIKISEEKNTLSSGKCTTMKTMIKKDECLYELVDHILQIWSQNLKMKKNLKNKELILETEVYFGEHHSVSKKH